MAKATSTLPILKLEDEVWTGDRMDFRLSGMGAVAFGNVLVGDKDVRIEITLPWLLQRFAEAIQGAIKAKSQVLLERRSRLAHAQVDLTKLNFRLEGRSASCWTTRAQDVEDAPAISRHSSRSFPRRSPAATGLCRARRDGPPPRCRFTRTMMAA